MTNVPDGSAVRLAYVNETVINTTPSTPSFKTLRYLNSDIKMSKQTDTPDEVTGDGNRTAPVDVGRSNGGTINCDLSYGTFDDLIAAGFRAAWATNVLKNALARKTMTLEAFFDQGSPNTFVRYTGVSVNTIDMALEAKKPVTINFGVMGLSSPDPTGAIITGATYAAQSTTEVMNAALNVASLSVSGITNSPIINKLSLKTSSNMYSNDAVGMYDTYSQNNGLFDVDGSFDAFFENKDTYLAILHHTTVGLSFTVTDAAGNSYLFEIPSMKLMDGGPQLPGNSKPVMLSVPFKAFKDPTLGATMRITRTPAP
jgi:hypothetical protein